MKKPKRNWAKGSRLAFLNSHLKGFVAACLQSHAKASDYTDRVINEYFVKFNWHLPLNKKPATLNSGDFTNVDTRSEVLTDEEEERKGKIISQMKTVSHDSRFSAIYTHFIILYSISAWLAYWTKKGNSKVKAKNDPY